MFEALRNSRFFGSPIELYAFRLGNSPVKYLFTDSESEVTFGGEVYRPTQIKRTSTTNSGSLDKSSMEVATVYANPVAELFRVYPPVETVNLTVYQGERLDSSGEFRAIWVGRVLSCSWEGVEAKLNAEPISTSFRRSGLRLNYQYMCPHMLYGPKCRANKAVATTPASVFSASFTSIVLNAALSDPSRYEGGEVSWQAPDGSTVFRTIMGALNVGLRTELTLLSPLKGLAVGDSVSVSLGCKHTLASCRADHNNAPNFGGMPWIPLNNPIGNVSPF